MQTFFHFSKSPQFALRHGKEIAFIIIKILMDKNNNTGRGASADRIDNEKQEDLSSIKGDLKDSKRDEERLQPDEATLIFRM